MRSARHRIWDHDVPLTPFVNRSSTKLLDLGRSGSKSSVRSAQDLKEDDEKPKETMDSES